VEAFKRYVEIVEGKRKAKFIGADLEKLMERAWKLCNPCRLCEIRCGARRPEEIGYCRADFSISSEFLHFGEESLLIPSHTIFFTGCNFRCVFCQNWRISQVFERGLRIEPERMAKIIEARGGKNVNWVGGEPTPNLPYVLEVIRELKKDGFSIAQIWNTNAYMSSESMEILNRVIDLWLPDFKYGNNRCALRLSAVPRYFDIVTRNLLHMKGDILIRHLVMPNHFECCTKPVLEWIAENLGDKVGVNVMDQYRPEYRAARYEEISRPLSRQEFEKAMKLAHHLDLVVVD